MKKVFSVILALLFGIMLLATLCLGIVQKYVSFQTIIDLSKELTKATITEAPSTGLYHPGKSIVVPTQYTIDTSGFDPSQIDLSSFSSESFDIDSLIGQFAGDADIDYEFVGKILEDEDTVVFIDYFFAELFEYETGFTSELNFDVKKIETFVNKTIDKYEEYSGETVDRTGLSETILTTVEMTVPEIAAALDENKKENQASFEAFLPVIKILQPETLWCAIGICVVLILLILLINRNVAAWLKCIGLPAIIVGLILFVAVLIAFAIIPDASTLAILTGIPASFSSPVMSLVTMILMTFRSTGILTAITGIALLVAGCIMGKKNATAVVDKQEVSEE